MSTWAVQRTGDNRVISWNGKPLECRINWDHFTNTHRAVIREAIADVCPRVGSGFNIGPQTTKKPLNGQQVWLKEQGATDLFVYAKDFNLIDAPGLVGALGLSDQFNIGDEFKGAVVIFNTRTFPSLAPGDFKAIAYHEMGHAVGLEHPTVMTQLMSPQLTDLPWKFGDLRGLRVLLEAH